MKIKDYELRAQVAKALGHPTRLLILDALQEREMCVSELTEMIGCDQSTASKHIAILKNVGLVKDRKEGSSSYYSLLCPCVQRFFNCLEEVVFKNAERYQNLCGKK